MSKRAASVPVAVYLETVLKMGEYSLFSNKFKKPVSHAAISKHFGYSDPKSSYIRYRQIKKMLQKESSGSIKLPHIPINPNRSSRKYEQLVDVLKKF